MGSSDDNRARASTTLLCPGLDLPQGATAAGATLERYLAIVGEAFVRHGGRATSSGDGSLLGAFEHPGDAVAAAVDLQRALAREPWPADATAMARVGLHAGEPERAADRHVGLDVGRTLAISAAAHRGQTLLSAATRAQLGGAPLPAGVTLRDLGWQRLAGLHYPEALVEVVTAGLPDAFPPVRSLANRPTNLAPARSSFVGRAEQVRDLRAKLLRPDTRLITLTGASGSGKTRLALQVAAALLDVFPDGVFQVPLGAATEPALAVASIVRALPIVEVAGQPALDGLIHQLAGRRALLVLDQIDPQAGLGPLLAQLLAGCSQLKVLATSVGALGVRGERAHDVCTPRSARIAARTPAEASALFLARAGEFDPGFTLEREDAPAVDELCARLENAPLAVELAAASVHAMAPRSIAAELGARLASVEARPRTAAAAALAVQTAIVWSYGLLDVEQQSLLRRAAVFVGGVAQEAAAASLAVEGEPGARIAGQLDVIVQRQLLRREHGPCGPRLQMHEAVREHALSLLAERGEQATARAAQARHCAAAVERAAPHLMGREQRRHVEALLAETDNLRAAFAEALERGDFAAAARMTHGLLWLWIPQGLLGEGQAWTARALRASERAGRSLEHALLLEASGWLAFFSGDAAAARGQFERALGLLRERGTPADVARAELGIGIVAGRMLEGPRRLLDALARQRELGDRHGTALALIALGDSARAGGDEAAAAGRYDEALALLRAIDNLSLQGQLLQNLAHLRLHAGNWRAAAALLGDALELGREYNQPQLITQYVAAMGGVGVVRGRLREGARLLGAASTALQLLGAAFTPGDQQEIERQMASARSQLGDEAFERAFAEGSHWSLEAALTAAAALRG